MKEFKQIVKDYWAVQKDVDFYDDNGELVELDEGRKWTVEKEMEQLIQKEMKNKDIEPPGPRRLIMYLGEAKIKDS